MKLNITNLKDSLTRTTSKLVLQGKKHSPEVLVVAGIAGVITSGVMACKATLKVNDILEESKEQREAVHKAGERLAAGETLTCKDGSEYTIEQNRKDLTLLYVHSAAKFVKLYGPSVLLGVASVSCIIGSHRILSKRNAALATAYKIVDSNFKDYRKRVVDRFGKELDRELRYDIKNEEIETIEVDEDGNETIKKEVVKTAKIKEPSEFARFFDQTCTSWTKNPELNKAFLMNAETYMNQRLRIRGYLFLNEVYEYIGIKTTTTGSLVGWIYDPKEKLKLKDKTVNRDNYVDFGMFDVANEAKRDFINGYERSILLDFNVDGYIYQDIDMVSQ